MEQCLNAVVCECRKKQTRGQPISSHMLVCRVNGMLAVTWLLHAAFSNAHLEVTCPVHVLGPILDSCQHGQLLFEGISSADALGVLRMLLGEIGVKDSKVYRTHDLRRGHALDLQLSGRA